MHRRIVRPQTWPFVLQLGVFTLTTALLSALVTWLVWWQTPATATQPAVLAGLAALAGLAGGVCRSLVQQGRRVSTLIQQIAPAQPLARTTEASPDTGAQMSDGVRARIEHTLALLQRQAGHIADSTSTLDELAVSIQQAAENAARSATAAEQALMHAQQGTTAVHTSMQGLQDLGTQVREVARRLQHLEEHSQAVERAGQVIGELADRTSVLALNMSVQATRADAAGHECVVAAEEVHHLSGRTTDGTRRIAHLAHTMQRETHALAVQLEEKTARMAQGVQAATQAGCALYEIAGVSARLTELIQSIRLETTQQSCDATTLSKAMAALSAVTHQALEDTRQAVAVCDDLLILARP